MNGSTSTSLDVRVMNLHVHSKTLWRFVRRRRSGSDFVDLAGSYVPAAVALRTTKVGNLGE